MTEPHPQPKCHGYACRVFEECTDRYDDDEFPPCASHSSAVSERDKVLVYSRIVTLPKIFPCITGRELAFKEIENNGDSQSWTSLNVPLEPGDEIRIYRSKQKGEQK